MAEKMYLERGVYSNSELRIAGLQPFIDVLCYTMTAMNNTQDKIRAVDAKFEAQKIAFAPMEFQAARSLRELGILQAVSDAGDDGLTCAEIAARTGTPLYGVRVLVEMGLGMHLLFVRDLPDAIDEKSRFVLGKTGWFLLEDDMTRVNMDFTHDVCYQGAFYLLDAVKTGVPAGLTVFGDGWRTIYEALSSLPEGAKKSWFAFDHFYSGIAFPEALPIVLAEKPHTILDIGGNTAKWAITCCKHDPDVHVTILDLPGQTDVAEKNVHAAGFSSRIGTVSCNILDQTSQIPQTAERIDAVWMSQFLDCFSLEQISGILAKIHKAVCIDEKTDVWVLEPLVDMQHFEAASYSLRATSLYFTCMANGTSRMYRFGELKAAIEKSGWGMVCAHHNLGSNCYSLLQFRKKI